jgi:murein DD-endopeptidase MepM/ murein hydrolase activator NlpD
MRKPFIALNLWGYLLGTILLMPIYSFYNSEKDICEATNDTIETATAEEIRNYPKDYFISPIDVEIKLTGTFGELRPDHFHSGIDLKSKNGSVGQPVFATADGFVDQIKVQTGGYGNVIYIKHPNGYTTVYAHLDRFSPELERYVRENQYEKERFEVSLQPRDGQFKFKKGQEIGKLGNTGGSTGPHLHFEIRNSATGKALNPQLFGLPIPDKVAPDIRGLKLYVLNEKREVQSSHDIQIVDKGGNYSLKNGDTIRIGAWRVGFGIKVYDEMSGFKNDNGIYGLTLKTDETTVFDWDIESLDFDETRFMNAHIDYEAKQKRNTYYHRCFILPGNRLNNYNKSETGGAINLYQDRPIKIHIKATDPNQNASDLTFWVIRDDLNMETFNSEPYQYELPYDQESKIEQADFSMFVPKNCFYETVLFRYATTPDYSFGSYSSVHHLHDEATPVHKYFELAIRPDNMPEELRSKAVIARCGDGRAVNCGGTWKGEKISTKIREFGDYCIMIDNEAPNISPVVFDDDMRKKSTMSFRITDNFGISGSADGMTYKGFVDGQWVLFEYDRKKDRLTHTFDGRIGAGEHSLRLVVKDDRDNEAVFDRIFIR